MGVATIERTNANVSQAVIRIFSDIESEASTMLRESALTIIDDYMSKAQEDSAFNEESFSGDLNAFLKTKI